MEIDLEKTEQKNLYLSTCVAGFEAIARSPDDYFTGGKEAKKRHLQNALDIMGKVATSIMADLGLEG